MIPLKLCLSIQEMSLGGKKKQTKKPKPTNKSLAKTFNAEEPWQESQQGEEKLLLKNWHTSTVHKK